MKPNRCLDCLYLCQCYMCLSFQSDVQGCASLIRAQREPPLIKMYIVIVL